MGTSRNDRSPDTPPWRLAQAVLGRSDVPVERQSREIWLAVHADRGDKLIHDLSHPALAEACRAIDSNSPLSNALRKYEETTRYEAGSGFVLEMGKRALIRSIASEKSATEFIGELFAEAVSYYVSRDLPSYVGSAGRVRTTSQSIRLKEELREVARQAVRSAGTPTPSKDWSQYVTRIVKDLEHTGRPPR